MKISNLFKEQLVIEIQNQQRKILKRRPQKLDVREAIDYGMQWSHFYWGGVCLPFVYCNHLHIKKQMLGPQLFTVGFL